MKNILLATTCLGIIAACTQAKKETTAQLPNIVIIYDDDLGYNDVCAYGATRLKTPNIDKLAKGVFGLPMVMRHLQPALPAGTPCLHANIPVGTRMQKYFQEQHYC